MAYFNRKTYPYDGIKFRSRDEMCFYKTLTKWKNEGYIIDFWYEPDKITLIPKYEYDGKRVQAMTYTPDFKIENIGGFMEYVEVKGRMTEQATLKVKIFKYRLSMREEHIGYWLISRSLKFGIIEGEWIEYKELVKLRAKNSAKNKGADEDV